MISLDLAKAYDVIDTFIKATGPEGTMGLSNPTILGQQGVDLRRDLLANLGPKLAFYTQSTNPGQTNSSAGLAASRASGTTFVAELRDQGRVVRAIDPLMRSFGPLMRQRFRLGPRERQWLIAASLRFRRTLGPPHPQYVIDWPPNSVSAPYSQLLQPTVAVGETQLVFAASQEATQGALAGGKPWQPEEAFLPLARKLPTSMVYMRLADPRPATSVLVAALPVLIRQINAEIASSSDEPETLERTSIFGWTLK